METDRIGFSPRCHACVDARSTPCAVKDVRDDPHNRNGQRHGRQRRYLEAEDMKIAVRRWRGCGAILLDRRAGEDEEREHDASVPQMVCGVQLTSVEDS